jgi:hypothetical protein
MTASRRRLPEPTRDGRALLSEQEQWWAFDSDSAMRLPGKHAVFPRRRVGAPAAIGAAGERNTMNAAAGLDILDFPFASPARAAEVEREQPPKREQPSQRWWFTFDGWHSADRDAEYVLA